MITKFGDDPELLPPPVEEAAPEAVSERKSSGWLSFLLTLAALGVISYGGYRVYTRYLVPSKGPATIARKATPVLASPSRVGNMDLYLNGLGTVTAYYSVTIRSRVDGELIKVNFEEGQMVEKGKVLVEIDPRPYEVQLQQAKGPLARDQAALEIAKLNLDRYKILADKKSIAQQEYDAQESLVKQSEGTLQLDLAQIANAELLLSYCKIASPITGRIGLRLVDPGNMVRANDTNGLAVVTQLQPIAVVFTIPQDEIARVQNKMKGKDSLAVEAYNRNFSIKLAAGDLTAIDNQVDATTGTVKLKAVFKNEDNLLFPNQFVNVRLKVDTREDAIIVPAAAVQRGPSFNFVYVVKSDSTVELRKVTTGPTEGAEMIVNDGLVAGELVVTDGIEKLAAGSSVVLRDPNKKESGAPPTKPADKPAAVIKTAAENLPSSEAIATSAIRSELKAPQ